MDRGSSAEPGRQLELLQIKRWVGETTFERGLDYADRGRVGQAAREGDTLAAEVEGSTPRGADEPARYRVRVDLEPPVPRATCTCPVRRPFCKHAAAVLIMWQREPEGFAAAEEDVARPAKPDVSPKPKPSKAAQRQRMRLEELDAVGRMIRDIAGDGIAVRGSQWVEAIPDMLATARRRRQMRLAGLLEQLHKEVSAPASGEAGFDWRRWAELLADLWFTVEAMRQHVEGRGLDERALEQLVGRTPREAGLARRYEAPLLQLAYEVFGGPLGTRHDVSYLMDLNSGELFVERAVIPQRRAKSEGLKPSYPAPILAREMGIYPGYPPLRIALIAVDKAALNLTDATARALDLADTSLPGIHQRLVELTAEPLAPRETFALLRLRGLPERDGELHLLDAEGYAVPVAEAPSGHPPTLTAFQRYAGDGLPPAVFARFFARDAALCAAPLSIVEPSRIVRTGSLTCGPVW